MRRLRAWWRKRHPLQLDLTCSGDLDKLFFEWLADSIKVRGGNPRVIWPDSPAGDQ